MEGTVRNVWRRYVNICNIDSYVHTREGQNRHLPQYLRSVTTSYHTTNDWQNSLVPVKDAGEAGGKEAFTRVSVLQGTKRQRTEEEGQDRRFSHQRPRSAPRKGGALQHPSDGDGRRRKAEERTKVRTAALLTTVQGQHRGKERRCSIRATAMDGGRRRTRCFTGF